MYLYERHSRVLPFLQHYIVRRVVHGEPVQRGRWQLQRVLLLQVQEYAERKKGIIISPSRVSAIDIYVECFASITLLPSTTSTLSVIRRLINRQLCIIISRYFYYIVESTKSIRRDSYVKFSSWLQA